MSENYVKRHLHDKIKEHLKSFPAIAILGPRQAGKSTLAKQIVQESGEAVYLDLERQSEIQKLSEPEMYFELHRDKLICLDEIQRISEIFSLLRSVIDERNRNGQFLILGSASRDLIRQTSESLAGRIIFLELNPFSIEEVVQHSDPAAVQRYWLRGGFPRSFLADSDEVSMIWRENFIRTFLERDIPQLGFQIPAETMRRLWQICAHQHGQLLNLSNIGAALGFSHTTVRSYMDLLSQTFMLRLLPPYTANIKKRQVKSPKLYLRDSGLLHALLGIPNSDALLGHPIYGASWEGMVLEHILGKHQSKRAGFYRTSAGAEMDLVIEKGAKRIGLEFKASRTPQVTRGFWNALDDLNLERAYIIAPVKESYPVHKKVTVTSVHEFLLTADLK
jgi:predicted AAA+ superfamily ATPase